VFFTVALSMSGPPECSFASVSALTSFPLQDFLGSRSTETCAKNTASLQPQGGADARTAVAVKMLLECPDWDPSAASLVGPALVAMLTARAFTGAALRKTLANNVYPLMQDLALDAPMIWKLVGTALQPLIDAGTLEKARDGKHMPAKLLDFVHFAEAAPSPAPAPAPLPARPSAYVPPSAREPGMTPFLRPGLAVFAPPRESQPDSYVPPVARESRPGAYAPPGARESRPGAYAPPGARESRPGAYAPPGARSEAPAPASTPSEDADELASMFQTAGKKKKSKQPKDSAAPASAEDELASMFAASDKKKKSKKSK
jgi:hypothetical protein